MGAGYFSRSARIVLGDPKWWRKVLVLVLVGAVPLVGAVYKLGYEMVFMRGVAWGVQRGVPGFDDTGGKFKAGLAGLVVTYLWSLVVLPLFVVVFAAFILNSWSGQWSSGVAPSVPAMPWWLSLALWIPSAILSVWSTVAVLRTAMYMDTGAGMQVSQVVALTRRERRGFLKVTGLMLALFFAEIVFGLVGQHAARSAAIAPFLHSTALFAWALLVSLLTTPASLLTYGAYGLWARDTDPSTWPPLSQRKAESVPQADPHDFWSKE